VPWLADRGITVAVGSPLEGVDGFRLSHLEAQRAQQIAFLSKHHSPLTLFPEVELLSLMSSSPEGTQRFVLRTLGGLADDAEGPTRLRRTLHALLSSGSVDEASRRLSVHKNTVRYRVSQAEALLGSPGSWVASEVELAIRYYESLLARPPTS
jgi:DNA-binding PucR family transcriptional regulator